MNKTPDAAAVLAELDKRAADATKTANALAMDGDDYARVYAEEAEVLEAAARLIRAAPPAGPAVDDAMVERVARALARATSGSYLTPDTIVTDIDNKVVSYWKSWEEPARAALTAALAGQVPQGAWLDPASAPTGRLVLACIETESGRQIVIRALRAGENELPLGDEQEWWEGCTTGPDEETYCAPGWYETNQYEETNWYVHDRVIGWMPLPPTAKKLTPAPQEPTR